MVLFLKEELCSLAYLIDLLMNKFSIEVFNCLAARFNNPKGSNEMKRHFLSPLVAVLTFLLGFYFTLLAVSPVDHLPDFRIANDDEIFRQRKFSGELEVKYLGSTKQKFGNSATFLVTNNLPEVVYYSGYNKNSNVNYRIRKNGKLEPRGWICGTGLTEQSLMPGETTTFQVYESNNSIPYEAGFEFFTEAETAKKTVWVKVSFAFSLR